MTLMDVLIVFYTGGLVFGLLTLYVCLQGLSATIRPLSPTGLFIVIGLACWPVAFPILLLLGDDDEEGEGDDTWSA